MSASQTSAPAPKTTASVLMPIAVPHAMCSSQKDASSVERTVSAPQPRTVEIALHLHAALAARSADVVMHARVVHVDALMQTALLVA